MQACPENFQSDARAKDVLRCESREEPEIIFVLKNNWQADGANLGIFYYGKQRHLVTVGFRESFYLQAFPNSACFQSLYPYFWLSQGLTL